MLSSFFAYFHLSGNLLPWKASFCCGSLNEFHCLTENSHNKWDPFVCCVRSRISFIVYHATGNNNTHPYNDMLQCASFNIIKHLPHWRAWCCNISRACVVTFWSLCWFSFSRFSFYFLSHPPILLTTNHKKIISRASLECVGQHKAVIDSIPFCILSQSCASQLQHTKWSYSLAFAPAANLVFDLVPTLNFLGFPFHVFLFSYHSTWPTDKTVINYQLFSFFHTVYQLLLASFCYFVSAFALKGTLFVKNILHGLMCSIWM